MRRNRNKGQPTVFATGSGYSFTQLSERRPRAYWFTGFLTAKECEELVKGYEKKVDGAGVLQLPDKGTRLLDERKDEVSNWLMVPPQFSEDVWWLVRVEAGGELPALPEVNRVGSKGGTLQRLATVLLFLTTPGGGEVVFTEAEEDVTSASCGKAGLVVRPEKGGALLEWHVDLQALDDPVVAKQAYCPVTAGPQWVLVKRYFTEEISYLGR